MSVHSEVLKEYWGYAHFRPLQEDIILSVLKGQDTLALLPTGGGKSICYQVPALSMDGICIVISPLIALMKDQVENLRKRNIKAVALISGMSYREIDIALDNCNYGDYKFLYVSPERLASELFIERLKKMKVNLLAVDEAHCISQWGHDFRPSYRKIAEISQYLTKVPILALTATATSEVRVDIIKQLELRSPEILIASFARSNLTYAVIHDESKHQVMQRIFKNVQGCGIVYVRNRRRTEEISNWLNKNNIPASFYHAGLPRELRSKRQDEWMNNTTRVIVATNAFGMGIDKPDVRIVIHFDLPDNLESYYQEAGRGGRDGKLSFAVAIYTNADLVELKERAAKAVPAKEEIIKVYNALSNYLQVPLRSGLGESFPFDISSFSNTYQWQPINVLNCLKILELENYLSLTDSVYLPSRLHFEVQSIELYKFQVEHIHFDHVIKTILRTCEGVFDRYVDIYESDLAKKTGLTLEDFSEQLYRLQKLNVISYLPKTDQPQIIFTQQRVDGKNLTLRKELIEHRQHRFKMNADKLTRYISSKNQCRSLMLLEYFNERGEQRCGTCDYCRQRNKLELSDYEFNVIASNIRILLKDQELTPEEIGNQTNAVSLTKVSKVIQWMLDNEMIRSTKLGKFSLVER